jgi:hypothetical protein
VVLLFGSPVFNRHVSSLIQYLTNELSPENCEEERMPLVLLYVNAILHLLTFAVRVLCGQGIAALRVLWPRAIILDLCYAIL